MAANTSVSTTQEASTARAIQDIAKRGQTLGYVQVKK